MRLATALLPLCLAYSLSAQVYEFTGGGDTNDWGDNENWKQGAQDPANNFPENGAEAIVDGVSGLLSSKLSKNISLSSFQLAPNQQFSLNLDGNTLDVEQLREFGATSIFRDGTLNVDSLDIDDLRVVNTTFNIAGGTITGSGLQLWSGTTATLDGTLSIGANGLASGDADAKFINAGGSIFKENTDALATVGIPFEQTGGELNIALGTLSFTSSATFTGGDIEVSGSENSIRFQGATSLLNTTLNAKSGASIIFSGPLTSPAMNVGESSEGTLSISIDNNGAFSVSDFNGTENSPISLNIGAQDTNTPASNSGIFIWGGGVLDDFTNNSEMRIEPTGASFSGRGLTGLLSNNGIMEAAATITLKAISVIQNETGGTIKAASGTIKPFAGDLEQTGFANLGTIETPFSKGSLNVETRIINRGEIVINKGSINFSGPITELGGQVTLSPHSFADGFETALKIGGNSDIAHSINSVHFMGNTPLGENGGARAIFGRGQYTISGEMSSSAAAPSKRFGVFIERGTWKTDTGGSFSFSENLPLKVGGENIYPTFELDTPLNNSGHMEITRAAIVGEETFLNSGTITARRLEIGNNDASGKLTNERDLILFGGAPSVLQIKDGSLFLNKGENAVLSLADNATVDSPLDAVQLGFENSGTIRTAGSSSSKSINVLFRQKGSNSAMIETIPGSGNLTIRKKAEIEEGILKSATTLFFTDDVEWGKSATPEIQFVDGGEINYFGNGKQFTLLDHLLGSGDGTFEMDFGILAPEAGATKDIDFSGDSKLKVTNAQLGLSDTTLRNFGNIEQSGGELHGSLINAGIYDLNAGTFENATFTNLNTFNWNGTNISGTINNTNDFTDEGPRPAMNIKGSNKLLEGSSFTNNGMVTHYGRLELENNTTLNLASGTYQLTDAASIMKPSSSASNIQIQVQSGATLLSARDQSSSGSSFLTPTRFELNGGTLETQQAETGLSILSSEIILNGGFIRVGDEGSIYMSGNTTGNIGSLIVGKGGIFTLVDSDEEKLDIPSNNIVNRGTINGNIIQSGTYDTYDPDDEDLFVPAANTIDGDLTQTEGENLKTVVRANNEGASTINVKGKATVTGPVVIVLDENYEGTEIPIMTAAELVASWNTDVQIVSTNPGLTGTISYPNENNAVVTIEREAETGPATRNYRHYVYTHFNPEQRADPQIWSPNADPDGDGVTNLQSFVQNDNPTDGIAPPPLISDFSIYRDCDACQDCTTCDQAPTYLRCTLNLEDDFSGVAINIRSLGDLGDDSDNILSAPERWIDPNDPDAYNIQIQVAPSATDAELYDAEISLNEGETIL